MNILIKLKKSETNINQMTIQDVAAQAYVFFLGGFISTSSILIYLLPELSIPNQNYIQDKARQEITKIRKKYNGNLTLKAFKKMKYIEMIIQGTFEIKVILFYSAFLICQ